MDEEDFIQFTICALDKFHRVNSNEFALVSDNRGAQFTRKKKDDELKDKIATNMGRVGDGVLNLSYVTLQREIQIWEAESFRLDVQVDGLEEEDQTNRNVKLVNRLKKRILSLDTTINDAKKRFLSYK